MAASGYTPISLYYSNSAGVSPTAGNLVNGELALNIPDGKLYYKDGATVKLLASNAGATGTVSSVAASVPAFLSVSGSPITTSGTLAISYSGTALPVANGGTNATSAGISAFNNITGYSASGATGTTSTNLVFSTSPTLVTPNLGTPSAATLTNATGLPLTTGVTGTLPVANGGTGSTTLTANNVLLGNGTSALQVVAPGTSGNILTSDGTTWTSAAPSAAGGSITATASGSISAGAPVLLNSSGQAVAITNTVSNNYNPPAGQAGSATAGPNSYSGASTYSNFNKIVYNPINGRISCYWISTSLGPYLLRSYFTTSGFTITLGEAQSSVYADGNLQTDTLYGISAVIYSQNADRYYGLLTPTSSGQPLKLWSDTDADAYSVVSSVGGGAYGSNINFAQNYELASDATGSKIAVAWQNSSLQLYCAVGTTSSTAPYITWGNIVQLSSGIDTADNMNQVGIAMNPNGNEFVVSYAAPNAGSYTYCALLSVSGTTSTLQQTVSPTETSSNDYRSNMGRRSIIWMPSQSKYILTFWVNGASSVYANMLKAVAFSSSGTALTFGTPVTIFTNGTTARWGNNFPINLPVTPGYFNVSGPNTMFWQGSLSGYTITQALYTTALTAEYQGFGYNSDSGGWIYFYPSGSSIYVLSYPRFTTNLSSNFIGFSAASYTTGQTATVTAISGTNTLQSGLTPGTRYYIENAGSLGTVSSTNYAGQALSATSILVKG